MPSEWSERVASINQWSRSGTRAPHKPLLILYAIGRLLRFGSSTVSFREAEEPLKRLILTYGPPTSRATPNYPFHHLQSDGLWQVEMTDGSSDPGSTITDLRRAAVGHFTPKFEQSLADPGLRTAIVGSLLDDHFAPSLHDDLLADVGIDTIALHGVGEERSRPRRGRDPRFRDQVMAAYEYRCAFCGFDGRLESVTIGLDAAHVRWHALDGPDTVDNGLALCTIHHKLFDKGALGLDEGHCILVSQRFVGRGDTAERLVLDLANRQLVGPQPGQPPPAEPFVEWHAAQVFKGPARAA